MQAFHLLPLGGGVADDHPFVTLVGHIFTNVVLVVRNEYALAMAAIFCIQLHRGMEGGAGTSEKVEDDGGFM